MNVKEVYIFTGLDKRARVPHTHIRETRDNVEVLERSYRTQ